MGREAGYLKGVGAGRNGKNFATLAQYFTIGKAHGGGNRYGRGGNREYRVREAGSSDPPVPPHHSVASSVHTKVEFSLNHSD